MSLAGNRPINWNLLTLEQDEETRAHRLSTSDAARAAGACVVALAPCAPFPNRQALDQPTVWESMTNWPEVMHLPLEDRLEAFKRPDVRARLRDGAALSTRRWKDFANYTVGDV